MHACIWWCAHLCMGVCVTLSNFKWICSFQIFFFKEGRYGKPVWDGWREDRKIPVLDQSREDGLKCVFIWVGKCYLPHVLPRGGETVERVQMFTESQWRGSRKRRRGGAQAEKDVRVMEEEGGRQIAKWRLELTERWWMRDVERKRIRWERINRDDGSKVEENSW